jgi:esterase FrsA
MPNDVAELGQFVHVHARNQNLPAELADTVLAAIKHDTDGVDGSWAVEWTRVADKLAAEGNHLGAAGLYNLARFPFVDGPTRAVALRECVSAFMRWAVPASLEPLTVSTADGDVHCWTSGLSTTQKRPLVVLLGGIVAVKEQYAPVLLQLDQLGLAGVVTEMPGVGENELAYGVDSWKMFPAILDAVAGHADVDRTCAIAMSFSGHLAIKAALHDPRIKGIVTAGAPIRDFFTDTVWHKTLPGVTVNTLAHLLRCAPDQVGERIADWGLSDAQLDALDVPLRYVASARDEIIPADDVELIRAHVRDVDILEHDDVHGSPNHVEQSRMWSVLSALRIIGGREEAVRQLEAALA